MGQKRMKNVEGKGERRHAAKVYSEEASVISLVATIAFRQSLLLFENRGV